MDNNIAKGSYRTVTAQTARRIMTDIGTYTVIVDVRRPDEFRLGHIKNAVNIPLGQLQEKAAQFLPDYQQEIIVYCLTGSRSIEAANILLSMGYRNVFDLGGIRDWCYELEK